ncbi:hypothetical protein MMJ46_10505 [Enterococcus cecorum]|uniref:hypothetical protein n=1 Tax=Enterococcus cecorum TaxID=44008 RepID=UPI001FAB65C1|nr:hypothetical protein [Enterococcus cecorum]MCJ0597680.1 hypothetical protein [Enterococcus cecorum]
MKMIDALNLLAKGEIEENTKLIFSDVFEEFEYKYRKIYRTFVDENLDELDKQFTLDESFLNREVHLEQPSKQKYRIKLPHLEFYVGFAKNKNNEKEIFPYRKDNPTIEALIQVGIEKGLEFKTEFTEKDFEEIEELQPYEQFKELVKDDENE